MFSDIGGYLSSPSNRAKLLELLGEHVVLAVLPLLIGLSVAVPLGWAAQRMRWLRAVVLGSASVLYTVPSLALFVIMPSILGTRILDGTNVVVALALYTSALLVRPVVDALDAALSSPSGFGVVVDDNGAVAGGVRAEEVLAVWRRQRGVDVR